MGCSHGRPDGWEPPAASRTFGPAAAGRVSWFARRCRITITGWSVDVRCPDPRYSGAFDMRDVVRVELLPVTEQDEPMRPTDAARTYLPNVLFHVLDGAGGTPQDATTDASPRQLLAPVASVADAEEAWRAFRSLLRHAGPVVPDVRRPADPGQYGAPRRVAWRVAAASVRRFIR